MRGPEQQRNDLLELLSRVQTAERYARHTPMLASYELELYRLRNRLSLDIKALDATLETQKS